MTLFVMDCNRVEISKQVGLSEPCTYQFIMLITRLLCTSTADRSL